MHPNEIKTNLGNSVRTDMNGEDRRQESGNVRTWEVPWRITKQKHKPTSKQRPTFYARKKLSYKATQFFEILLLFSNPSFYKANNSVRTNKSEIRKISNGHIGVAAYVGLGSGVVGRGEPAPPEVGFSELQAEEIPSKKRSRRPNSHDLEVEAGTFPLWEGKMG